MAFVKVDMQNWGQWGKLVKTWATGEDRIKNGSDFSKRPATIEEFVEQATAAGAGPTVPPHITSIVFVQGDASTLVIRLPAAKMIKDSEAALESGARYELPDFYSPDAFGGAVEQIIDKFDFNDKRIGEYTIRNCQ